MEPYPLADSQALTRRPSRFSAAVARALRESAVIATAAAALVVLIALATYSPRDAGFFFTQLTLALRVTVLAFFLQHVPSGCLASRLSPRFMS